MEPNLEPRRRDQNPQRPFIKEPVRGEAVRPHQPPLEDTPSISPSAVTINKAYAGDYVRSTCLFMGVILLCVGLVGFVMDNFLTMHLSYAHSIVHVVAGVLALGFGYYSRQAARVFSYAAGTVFGVLGIAGFFAGQRGTSTVGHIGEDQFLWTVQANALEFGTADHIVHLIYAVVFIAGALFVISRRPQRATKASSR